MEVTKNQIDDLNIELTITLKAEDYAEQEKKRLSAYRRNADFKGFRKGMVPASLVKKVYGDQALYEAINGVVSEQLDKFIKDNNLHILGSLSPASPRRNWSGRMATISSSSSTSDCLQRSTLMLTRMTNCRITISR